MLPSFKSMIFITKFKVPSFSIKEWNSKDFAFVNIII